MTGSINTNQKTKLMVVTAAFVALIILLAFTPIGYIPLVVINATIIHIPVIVGSIVLGPKIGAGLGFVFGFTSFLNNTLRSTSLSAFVFSPVLAYDIDGVAGIFKSIFICFVPRILVGVIPYFVYKLIIKIMASEKKNIWSTVLDVIISGFTYVGVSAFTEKMSDNATLGVVVGIVSAIVVFAVIEVLMIKKNANILAYLYSAVLGSMTNTLLVMGGIYVLYKDAYAEAIGKRAGEVLGVITGVISFNGVVEAIVAAILVYAVGVALKAALKLNK